MYQEFSRHGVNSDHLHLVPLPTAEAVSTAVVHNPRALRGRLLFVGRLTRAKGVKYLIHAMARATTQLGRQLTLTIAGDGPVRREIERSVATSGLNVEFVGWVDTRQKLDLMRQSDLLVVPSLWPEPFGLVGIEAGSLGVPAVAFAVGGIPDWLIPGYSGELASGSPPSVQGLADAIVRAMGDGEHYASLCRGARETASRFTLDAHLKSLTAILSSA
jgi:glycosyltransferase involved in cell wall biosynthesis